VPQPHTFLPDFTATCFVAVPPALGCHTRLVLLDPGELAFMEPLARGRVISAADARPSGQDLAPAIWAATVEFDATPMNTAG
jgi:hypothetical protein